MADSSLCNKIWELFEYSRFFDGRVLATDPFSDEGVLREMVHYLGPCPAALVARSPLGDKFFDSQGMHSVPQLYTSISINIINDRQREDSTASNFQTDLGIRGESAGT